MKNKIQTHATRRRVFRVMDITGHWLRGFWPIVVVVAAGSTVLREAVVDSILSTPHPALVYGIFAVAVAAVWLTAVALFNYLREESLVLRLQSLPTGERVAKLQSLRWRPSVFPVCSAILSDNPSQEARLAAIDHELYAYEEHLTSTLTLPGYLSGALVGLGLVGTFVGLLGTLADLAGLFSAMTNMGGENTDPVAMFTDMLNKLQAPMRSMGTAFVASLYGLLGSLVLGLVIYSVKRSGTKVLGRIRALNRLVDSERTKETVTAQPSSPADAENTSVEQALLALVDAIRNDHAMLSKSMQTMTEDFQRHIEQAKELASALREGTVQVTLAQDSMAHLIELANVSQRQVALLEQASAKNVVQEDAVHEIKTAPTRVVRHVLPSVRRITLGVLVICGVMGITYAVLTLAQKWWSASSQKVAATEPSSQATAAPVEVATPATPASETPAPDTAVAAVAAVVEVKTTPVDVPQTVEVRSGQSLSRIAIRAGLPLKTLLAANPEIKNPNLLQVGQLVNLPRAQEGTAPAKD
jgi:LysM repeat protein